MMELREPSAVPSIGGAVFFSGEPKSIGHIYRVEQPADALRSAGWRAEWASAADSAAHAQIDSADVVVVFRAGLDAHFSEIRRRCSARGIPLVYDTDDLIFDPGLAADGKIALFDGLGEADRLLWSNRITAYHEALALADHATVSTEPLAAAARSICKSVFVLPNVLGPAMWQRAAAANQTRHRAVDGEARLIFASGTLTHHRDFQVAAEAVARVLAKKPGASLTILGELDLARFPGLAPFVGRIEKRPRVPFPDLFAELARADINLCPLEPDNLFCEAKSAVRCLAASAVGVPSIVSPTPPLLEAVENGKSGLVARDAMEWESALDRLIADSRFRNETGRKAQARALEISDFPKWSSQASRIFQQILPRNRPRPCRS